MPTTFRFPPVLEKGKKDEIETSKATLSKKFKVVVNEAVAWLAGLTKTVCYGNFHGSEMEILFLGVKKMYIFPFFPKKKQQPFSFFPFMDCWHVTSNYRRGDERFVREI